MKEKVVDPTAQIEVMTNDILDSSHCCVYYYPFIGLRRACCRRINNCFPLCVDVQGGSTTTNICNFNN